MNDSLYCSHCGAKITGRWERLSKGLVMILLKFRAVVPEKNNKVDIARDLNLTKNEYNNFQKLRYHGLVAKCEDQPSHWLLTRRGNQFISMGLVLPSKVFIFRNHIERYGDELVTIYDILHDNKKMFDSIEDFEYELRQEQMGLL